MAFCQATLRMAEFKLKPWSCEKLFLASRAPRQLGHISTLPPKSVGKRSSAAVCGAPAAAIGASGTLRSFHHGLAFGGAAAGPSDTAALRGGAEDTPEHLRDGQNVLTKRLGSLDCTHFGWGRSSVGRAPQWHCGGQGFESPRLHQPQGRRNSSLVRWRPSGGISRLTWGRIDLGEKPAYSHFHWHF